MSITDDLHEWSEGDKRGLDRVLPQVYDELRKLAKTYFEHEGPGLTLQATEVVNMVYQRLAEGGRKTFQNREHFFWYAGQMIRHLLTDHARAKLRHKRGGGRVGSLEDELGDFSLTQADPENIIALDQALAHLEAREPRQARIVEMRAFIGMTNAEIAEVLGCSDRTVINEWKRARQSLFLTLRKKSSG